MVSLWKFKIPQNYVILTLALFLIAFTIHAQVTDPEEENLIEKKVEQIAENVEEEVDYTTLVENLTHYYENPLNLNFATKEELQQLYLLTELQINSLLQHIEENGKLMSMLELQTVRGFDMETIREIQDYTTVAADIDRPRITVKEMFKSGKHDLFVRYQQVLEERQGFEPISDSALSENPNARYLGSPFKFYTRYRFLYSNKVSWGFTAEKDAGEEFFQGTQKNGFDFYSAHFYLKDIGKLKRLAIGDYQAQFGQGLTMWSGLAFGKTADGTGIKRNAIGLRQYTSADENLFLRGVGATYEVAKNVEVTGFFSRKMIDANIGEVDSASNEIVTITSLQNSGFHRTPNELEDKDAITETIYGGNVAYQRRNFNVGITGTYYKFSSFYQRRESLINIHEFTGKENYNVGVNYNYVFRNLNFFGEVATGKNGALGYTNGVLMSLDPRYTLSILHRNFQKDFQSIYSNAIGESSRNINEQGIYLGYAMKPYKHWSLTGYIDMFKFPWLSFRADAPYDGYEYLSQLTFEPSKQLETYFRIRQQKKEQNTRDEEPTIDYLDETLQTNYRFQVTYKVSKALKLRNRLEYVTFKRGDDELEQGFLIYQDVAYKALNFPLSFALRYALFQTDSWDSRIYAYENDVLFAFSIPAYYSTGSRWYATLRYKVARGIDVWLRYAQTYYTDRDVISSGLNEINGNTQSEVKVQVRFRF